MKKKIQIDISIKEKRLILVLLACILLFLAYQFGYVVLSNRTTSNNEKIAELEDYVSSLELMNINKSMYSNGIEECNSKINTIRGKFIKEETQEDNIMFIRTMEKNLGIEVYEINLYDKALITNLASAQSQTTTENTDTQNETTIDQTSDQLDSSGNPSGSSIVETGYNYVVDMKFRCSYEELKEMIAYINEYKYMRAIQSISVVFDADTGELIGELAINIYTLDEANNEYEEPITGITNLGIDDIFGTIH
jgi:hypothetical protein